VCVPQSMCPKNWTSQCHPSWESSGIFLRLELLLSWTLLESQNICVEWKHTNAHSSDLVELSLCL
jgi:hypothetical protein